MFPEESSSCGRIYLVSTSFLSFSFLFLVNFDVVSGYSLSTYTINNVAGHSGAITSISFSENGYYLATAADDACVKLWDLRKLKNFKTLQLDEGYQIKDLCFDQSGTYLAVAGTDIR